MVDNLWMETDVIITVVYHPQTSFAAHWVPPSEKMGGSHRATLHAMVKTRLSARQARRTADTSL